MWTTAELKRLRTVYHLPTTPTSSQLLQEFPRHTLDSIKTTACKHGLRPPRRDYGHLYWLKAAHLYFARREAEMRA